VSQPDVLHIDIDAFFAAAEVLLNPSLRGKPVIIGGKPDERGVVCTASYEARKFGIHSGMALRTAGMKCPHGIFLRGRYRVYSDISRRFFKCLKQFSPKVEPVSIDEAYIDLSGIRYLSNSVYERAEKIKAAVEKTIGLKVTAGLGYSKLGAKLATEVAKPGGFYAVLDEREFIDNLHLSRIPGIGPHTSLILQGLGVSRVKELNRAYPSIWKKSLGPHLFSSRRSTRGDPHRAKSYSRETTFCHDISDPAMIMSHLAYLIDRLAVYLARRKLYAGRVEVKVRFGDFSNFSKRISLDFPTFSFPQLWQKSLLILEDLLQKKRLPVRLVGVKVEEISQHRGLLPFVSLKGEQISSGVEQVKKRFGFSSIYTGRELLLEQLYPVERQGVVLRTASLTK
jgi:DNA polymerase-4